MKRSTLTLSVLTAILLSACGGSDSNTDQTTDKKNLPKTETPTVETKDEGSKGDAGATTADKKADKKEEKKDEKTGGGAGSASPQDKLAAAKQQVETAQAKLDEANNAVQDAQIMAKGKSDLAKEAEEKLKDLKQQNPPAAPADIQAAQEKFDQLNAEAKKAEAAKKAAEDAQAAAQAAVKDAENAEKLAKLDVEIAEAKHPAEKAAKEADKKVEEATQAKDKAVAEFNEANDKVEKLATDLVEAGKEVDEKDTALKSANADKTAAISEQAKAELALAEAKQAGKTVDELKQLEKAVEDANAEVTKQTKAVENAQEDLKKAKGKQKTLTDEKKDADAKLAAATKAKKQAEDNFNKAEGNQKKAAEANKFRSVAGSTGLSESNFVAIEKVEREGDKWKLTFSGDKTPIEIVPADLNQKIGSDGSYGSFGEVGDMYIATGKPQNELKSSIYGYIVDKDNNYKFFNAGEVTKADALKTGTIKYDGHALLQSKTNEHWVANVSGTASFDTQSFGGEFTNFHSFKPATPAELTEVKDLKEVGFKAKIDGNQFIPSKENGAKDARVYGYFYGTDGTEVGGLVEHDKFHGSFGGTGTKQ